MPFHRIPKKIGESPGGARLALLIVLALGPRAIAQAPPGPELRGAFQQIDALAAAELAKDNLAGLTLGVVSGAHLTWTKSYGFADIEKKAPATRETVYRIGSITKEFTALMLLQLVEQGKAQFSDPVEKYYPEVNKLAGPFPGAPPITLLQLATMTSGIAREPEDLDTYQKGPVSHWEKVTQAALLRTKFAFEPGTRYHYSNIGYAILGAALARAAGRPYIDYVQQQIFSPLGMTRTAFEPNTQIRPRLARGYQIRGGKPGHAQSEREHQGRGFRIPNGGMYSTVDDLARFVAFQLGEGPTSVLKKETLKESFSRVYSANGDLRSGYGIGFQVHRRGDLTAVGHLGSVAGYQAAAYLDRFSGSGVIVLRNAGGGAFQASSLALRALEKLAAARRG